MIVKNVNQGLWLPDLNLFSEDKEILLSDSWLNDHLINAAQKLLQAAFPHIPGFQCTLLGQALAFDVECGEFIQILHNGQGHWLMISTIGTKHPEVNVYDSLYSFASPSLKLQISPLLYTQHSHIMLVFKDVQMQCGSLDCGVFSIAFATALAHGQQPGNFIFDQHKLREHLFNCFESRKMSMFPIKKLRRVGRRKKATDTIQLYCICRLPKFTNSDWVQCSSCKEWFHVEFCVTVPEDCLHSKKPWYCSNC